MSNRGVFNLPGMRGICQIGDKWGRAFHLQPSDDRVYVFAHFVAPEQG